MTEILENLQNADSQEKQSCHSSVQEAGTAISTGMAGEAAMGPREEPGKI